MLACDKEHFVEICKAFTPEEQRLVVEQLPTNVIIDEVTRRIEKHDKLVERINGLCEEMMHGK